MFMSDVAVQAGCYLHHVAFESANPGQLAAFYADVMDMSASEAAGGQWRCEGPRRRMIVIPGESRKLGYAGLACRDAGGLEMLRDHIRGNGVELLRSPSVYFDEQAFAVRDPDGHLICFGLAKAGTSPHEGIHGPTQHLTFASEDVERFVEFYHRRLGFALVDRVLHDDGALATAFTTSNHEHHTIACFKSNRTGVDHHSYEAGEWDTIKLWCDRFASRGVKLMWGPGRHGPGNNLFVFIEDPDGNWIEVSAELEVIHDRPVKDWPQHPHTLNLWGSAIMRS
jgi:catechol 2,3-dioxygenase-like lactoylglutathione lyase family enzyme